MGSVHADAGATKFFEARYGDLHQVNVAGSDGVNEGEGVNGGNQGEWGLDQAIGSRGDLVRIAVNNLDRNTRVCEADLLAEVGISGLDLN